MVLLFLVTNGAAHLTLVMVHMFRMGRETLMWLAVSAATARGEQLAGRQDARSQKGMQPLERLLQRVEAVRQSSGVQLEVLALTPGAAGPRVQPPAGGSRTPPLPAALQPVVDRVLSSGQPADSGVYSDGRGSWFAVLAPVFDDRGRLVELVKAEHPVGHSLGMLAEDLIVGVCMTLAWLTITLLLARRWAASLALPLSALTGAVDAVSKGELQHPVPLDAPDELGLLARRFSQMRDDLARARLRDRLADVGQMAASMLHDLRGPLTVITLSASMLDQEEELEERGKIGRAILTQTDRLAAMATDVLDFSRGASRLVAESLEPPAFLAEVVGDLRQLANPRQVRLSVAEAWVGPVWADANKLRRIVYNLLKNAIEATPRGSKVEVAARAGGPGQWVLTVRDSGPGVPAAVAARLFQPFATAGKQMGTGLGLAIVKCFVDAHGGTVSCESPPGGGACFRVELPVEPELDKQGEAARTPSRPIGLAVAAPA